MSVVGNPPFLGDKKMRSELGDAYTETLRKTYEGRVPGGADLVCYWFDKARQQIANGKLQAAGLVSTNSIRGGANRKVLDAICEETRIFEAWSDEPWVNDGAAVRVSLVAFGTTQAPLLLDGVPVERIASDLSVSTIHGASMQPATLSENAGTALQGPTKGGAFDIPGDRARVWLMAAPNPNGVSNAQVLLPWFNGASVVGRWADEWIIDFTSKSEIEAALFEEPFRHVVDFVKPAKLAQARESRRLRWWLFNEPAPNLRAASEVLSRVLVTPEVTKHRVWVWLRASVCADKNLVVVVREDDTTFGVLQSRLHSIWALRYGTSLEDRPRYTSTSTFRTFPFPAALTPADTVHQQTEATASGALIPAQIADPTLKAQATRMAGAAAHLNTLRERWLNPPEWTERVPEVVPLGLDRSPYPDRTVPKPGLSEADAKALQKRTLTNLYNQRPAWLSMAHEALDAAVAAAYGWTDYSPQMSDDEILARLLALNLQRAAKA